MKIQEITQNVNESSILAAIQGLQTQRELLMFMIETRKRYKLIVNGLLDVDAIRQFNKVGESMKKYHQRVNELYKDIKKCANLPNKNALLASVKKLTL